MAKESAARPFYTVLVLAFVCSALVAGAAVGLRPRQEANQRLDQKKNILRAAGLYHKGDNVDTLFAAIEPRIVRLSDGILVAPEEMDPATFSPLKAALNADTGRPLAIENDPAGLARVERFSIIYLVRKHDKVQQVILPIRGKGLWSTMYGYVALSGDLNTINGVTFYQHGETPGLGGEIENEEWQNGWRGKKVYNPMGQAAFEVVKGKVQEHTANAVYQVDGISGATLTMKGVSKLMEFWFGDNGFKPFLKRFQAEGGIHG